MSIPAGTKLGRYEVRHLIGAGGMGEVYAARDPKIGRDVASALEARAKAVASCVVESSEDDPYDDEH